MFFGDELCRAPAAHEQLAGLGYLRAAAPSRSATCQGCGQGFVGRVEWVANRRTGMSTPYLPCPVCGPVAVAPACLRQWAVDVPVLLTAVFAAAGGRGTPSAVVPGHVWHLGNATWCGRSRQAYFARCVHAGSRPGVAAAVATHPKAVLFFPTEEAVRRWAGTTPNPTVALESVVSLGPDGIGVDAGLVESRLADAGLVDVPKKKPNPKRGRRAANIGLLTREVIEHLREAREHAFSTRDLTGTPALLPRPSQQELAERCDLSESDVSRCLKDETARELNLYWEAALDLDRIMNFRGPVGGGSAT